MPCWPFNQLLSVCAARVSMTEPFCLVWVTRQRHLRIWDRAQNCRKWIESVRCSSSDPCNRFDCAPAHFTVFHAARREMQIWPWLHAWTEIYGCCLGPLRVSPHIGRHPSCDKSADFEPPFEPLGGYEVQRDTLTLSHSLTPKWAYTWVHFTDTETTCWRMCVKACYDFAMASCVLPRLATF